MNNNNNNHTFILLDKKLMELGEGRRWKEYNSLCYILSIKKNKKGMVLNVPKVDQKTLLLLSNNGIEIEKCNICAICIKRHKTFFAFSNLKHPF
jgi:hypothetical protein